MASTSLMVDERKSYAAFFDLDDTLLEVNSGRALVREALGKGLMRKRDLAQSLWYSILHKMNFAHSTRLVKKMAMWLRGLEEKTIKDLSLNLCNNLLFDSISGAMLEEIEKHRSMNASIILLSAALPYVCEPIAEKLEMDALICSSLEVVDGAFTGLPSGDLVFGNEKSIRLESFCRENGFEMAQSYCYADSFSDRHMLEMVGYPVAVRPDRRLGNLARKNDWTVIRK